MAANDLIEMDGVVLEVFKAGHFQIETEDVPEVKAYLGGKMRKHHIKVVRGDRVRVAVSPYDLSRGRIIFRYK